MKRVLAIDYGEKRVGVAVSDPLNMLANPVECLDNSDHLISAISTFLTDYNVGLILVGLPLKLDGSDTKQTQIVREFAKRLELDTGFPIHLMDERFSSLAADRALGVMGISAKKRRGKRDTMAACFFLQTFLDSQLAEHYNIK